jgi:outer membrane protein assembly factor BamE (lipoprotein component of BamABCDE complex)
MMGRLGFLAVFAATTVFLIGCESKFNRRSFEMIRPGMDDREDVRQVMGKPTVDMEDVWFYDDLDHHKSAKIVFDNDGRVVTKEWMDAKTGEWEGTDPWTDEPPEGEVRERTTKTRRIHDD